jgi:hypothetical protein
MRTVLYKVAGHTFAVSGQAELFQRMRNYEPFECEGGEPLFSLTVEIGVMPEYTEVYRAGIIYGHTASGNDVFRFIDRPKPEACMVWSKDYREGRIIMTEEIPAYLLNYYLMLMYALATAEKDTLVLHAVVVSCEDKGYIFLGPCHTGKSTHARLWLEHVEGTELVNDDHPVVRGGVVYGSPWGGLKTPCHRNVSFPIGGIVRLSQAPENKIHRLSGIEAYLNLYCSDMRRIGDSSIAKNIDECLHQTKDKLAQTIPMWHLECLPDEAAARLCYETITNNK